MIRRRRWNIMKPQQNMGSRKWKMPVSNGFWSIYWVIFLKLLNACAKSSNFINHANFIQCFFSNNSSSFKKHRVDGCAGRITRSVRHPNWIQPLRPLKVVALPKTSPRLGWNPSRRNHNSSSIFSRIGWYFLYCNLNYNNLFKYYYFFSGIWKGIPSDGNRGSLRSSLSGAQIGFSHRSSARCRHDSGRSNPSCCNSAPCFSFPMVQNASSRSRHW